MKTSGSFPVLIVVIAGIGAALCFALRAAGDDYLAFAVFGSAIEEKLDACRQQLTQQGVPASFSLELGNDIVGSLMRAIEREHIDLPVISTHGMSGWHPFIFGSIAEHMIKQLSCTLLLLQSERAALAATEPPSEHPESAFVSVVPETQRVATATHAPQTDSGRRLDCLAGELAQQGARTEQRYDENLTLHNVALRWPEKMQKPNPITTLFVDVGGVLLTNGWDHLARKRSAKYFKLNWPVMDRRHRLVF